MDLRTSPAAASRTTSRACCRTACAVRLDPRAWRRDPVWDWITVERRHRRRGDAPHLQLRHRHDRVVVARSEADAALELLRVAGEQASVIGEVAAGAGVQFGRMSAALRGADFRARQQHAGARARDPGRSHRRRDRLGHQRPRGCRGPRGRPGARARSVGPRERARRIARPLGCAFGRASGSAARGLVVLAGFMRILSGGFVREWQGRLLNIHPSLLPALRGLHTHRRVLEARRARATAAPCISSVEELDAGPAVIQGRLARAARRGRKYAFSARSASGTHYLSAGGRLVRRRAARLAGRRCAAGRARAGTRDRRGGFLKALALGMFVLISAVSAAAGADDALAPFVADYDVRYGHMGVGTSRTELSRAGRAGSCSRRRTRRALPASSHPAR